MMNIFPLHPGNPAICTSKRKEKKTVSGLFLLFILVFTAVLTGFTDSQSGLADAVPLDENRWSCSFEGVKHDFILDFPENVEGSPLILMLHGYGGTAESFRLDTGFEKDANPLGYTVVYVTGAPNPGDRTSANGWNSGIGDSPNSDTAFLVALADYIHRTYHTDKDRVFAVGFSNGAFMVHRLALEAGDTFSAVVSVAGMMPASVWETKPESLETGLLQITGEKDSVIPKNSDGSAKYAQAPAIEDVIEYYTDAAGLPFSESEEIGNGSLLTKYTGSSSARQIWHLLVKNGRHSWSAERITGINTNQLILRYLETQ